MKFVATFSEKSAHHLLCFWLFKKKCVCCLIYLCVDQIDPFYTILEQEGWFRPTARLLFLILRVFVQSYDKNIKWQRDSWFAVTFPPPPHTSDCHPIKVAYLSVSLNVSRWMINMYIQTGIRCQLCIDSDVTEDVTFKLKWWHSISGSLVRWHLLLSLFVV